MIKKSKLHDYFLKWISYADHLLCNSQAETYKIIEILNMSSETERKMWTQLELDYKCINGIPELRKKIAKIFYKSLDESNILCFNGAEEAIFCALNSICKPNKNVIVVTPCYQSFIEIPRNNGCSVTQIQLLEEDKWDLRIPAIEEVIRPNTEAIIINCPNNITGLAFDSKKMSALVDLCKKYNLWLFNDETNKYFQKTDYNPTNSVCEMYEKGIVVSSLSKPFGLSGLRFGWVASKNKQILEQFLKFKHYLSACNSGPCEIIALIALNNKDYLIERNNQIISQNINILDKFMKDYDKLFFWIKPNCGCVGLVRYKNLNESVDILAKRLVKNVGILILPASVLHFNKQYFRIGFGKSDFPEAIKKLYIFFEKRK